MGIVVGQYTDSKIDDSDFPKGIYFVRTENGLMKFVK